MATKKPPEDIYELLTRVREHPDYVFGTVFTSDDFPSIPDDFRPSHAEETIVEAGFEYVMNIHGDEMPPRHAFGDQDENAVEWHDLAEIADDPSERLVASPDGFLDRLVDAAVNDLQRRLNGDGYQRYHFVVGQEDSNDWYCGKVPSHLSKAASQERAEELIAEWQADGYVFIDLTKPRKSGEQTARLIAQSKKGGSLWMRSDFNAGEGQSLRDRLVQLRHEPAKQPQEQEQEQEQEPEPQRIFLIGG